MRSGYNERVDRDAGTNDRDGRHGGVGFCTEEREQLCEYIDRILGEHGVDVAAPAARQGIDRSAITDRWRNW
ncbi:hypothetical protein ACFYZ5_02725 [Streptomyces chartreusis]|uniref:hypothetical protein n=1 Tax=Streptomyces chartreusis TaxID=1969 RepID=UPI0036C6936A